MRRVLGLLAAATLLAASLPATTLAARPTTETDTSINLTCDGLEGDAGSVAVFIELSERFGAFADMSIWAPVLVPFIDPPSIVTAESSVTAVGTALMANFDLAELVFPSDGEPSLGDPAGTAVLNATLEPLGPVESFSDRFREGNHVVTIEGTFQALSVSGTLDIDLLPGSDDSLDLSGCFAQTSTTSFTSTNPKASVFGSRQLNLFCGWETTDGFVELFAGSDRFGTFSEVFVRAADGAFFGFAEPTFNKSSFHADYDFFDDTVSASADATLSRGGRVNEHDRFGNFKFIANGWLLDVSGTLNLSLPSGDLTLEMDAASCSAQDLHVQEIQTRPGGPRLKNDAPSGALPISPGQTATARTGGTASEPEAPCTTTADGPGGPETFELPITNTAWWTFVGTGGSVTLDTAGSDFDTIIGVYLPADGGFEQVGCVDDVFMEPDFFSLQAAITVDTNSGQTYYVQAGGFAGSVGNLVLTMQ